MSNNIDNRYSSTYVLDTNLFRYYAEKGNDARVKQHRQAAIEFWNRMRILTASGQADLFIPLEVKNELMVQKHTLPDSVNSKIEQLLHTLDVDPYILATELELELRLFSSYVISQYRDVIQPMQTSNGKRYTMNYLQTSDARILASAYINDGILVTRNIKDFVIYLFLCPAGESRLYDFVEKQYITIPDEGMKLVTEDQQFQQMKARIEALFLL